MTNPAEPRPPHTRHLDLVDDGTDINTTDDALVQRATDSASVLTGLITAGMLRRVAQPRHLPTLLFDTLDPQDVQDIWNAALAVGYYAGLAQGGARWRTDHLDQLRAALSEAGYTGMAAATERAAYAAPSRPPPPTAAPDPDPAGAPATVHVLHPADHHTPRRHQ